MTSKSDNQGFAPVDTTWRPVVLAADCAACEYCGELVCAQCQEHYADCSCPGPHQDDEYEYRVGASGKLEAKPF